MKGNGLSRIIQGVDIGKIEYVPLITVGIWGGCKTFTEDWMGTDGFEYGPQLPK